MPTEERSTRAGERCELHPQSPSVARCESCGRTLCLECSVPVRGRVLGSECLSEALGADVPLPSTTSPRRRAPIGVILTTASFTLAALSTALPWTRFQEGSGPFGAWGLNLRWSVVAAAAAVAGWMICIVTWRRGSTARWRGSLRAVAAVVLGASVLAIAHPPAFAPPWVGPWVAVVAGAASLAATFASMERPAVSTAEVAGR